MVLKGGGLFTYESWCPSLSSLGITSGLDVRCPAEMSIVKNRISSDYVNKMLGDNQIKSLKRIED